jgi:CelD/BcsL family acetyltransferase involved in cellulose biosynthesis
MSSVLSSRALFGVEARRAFTSEWDELGRANPQATVFQTSGWYRAWLETVAAHELAVPIVLRVPDSGRCRAAVALQISHTGVTALRPLSWPWADYHDGVGSPFDHEAIKSIAWALEDLMAEQQCPLLLDDVLSGGLWQRILAHLPVLDTSSSYTSAIDLTDAVHLESVLSKKEYIRKWQRLLRLGPVKCKHHLELTAVLARLPAFAEQHCQQWVGRPDAVAPFDGGVVNVAFEAIIRHLAPRGLVIMTELILGDRPIAMYFGLTYQGRYGGYRTSFDNTYRRLSPGHLMLRQMIVDLTAAGFHELDLMRGDYMYKNNYTNLFRHNRRFELNNIPVQ